MSKETTTNTTDTTEAPKKRGRKPLAEGGKSTPRIVEVTCVAVIDDELAVETYKLGPAKGRDNETMLEEAKASFLEDHGVECDFATDPYYSRVGAQTSAGRRKSPSIDMETMSFSNRTMSVIHNKWNATARFIEGHDDAVFVIYKDHTEDANKKNKPQSKAVWLADLQIVDQPSA